MLRTRRPPSAFLAALLVAASLVATSRAQPAFDLDAYRAFLDAHASLGADDLRRLHDAGPFARAVASPARSALYRDSLLHHYALTDYEQQLLDLHGFMVTERLQPNSFGDGFTDIYRRDLPVFVSTDAVLHALHMSYDLILKRTEQEILIPRLASLLEGLRGVLPMLAERYDAIPPAATALRDVDVYLTLAATLLHEDAVAPVFATNQATIDALLALIEAEQPAPYSLFGETCRYIDFSQFTPRGHYTDEPELTRYFRAMIWLGRTELYLIGPDTDVCRPTEADVHRQTLMAALLHEAVARSETRPLIDEIDALIGFFVGEPDNVTLDHLGAVLDGAGIADVAELARPERFAAFQDYLAEQPFAGQRILSQILFSDTIYDPDALRPASAFLLLGQRFVIDAFVTGGVVFDAVIPDPPHPPRILPSTLDVLFALGNDAAVPFLSGELDTYGYAPELAALRFLIDAYDDDFWNGTLYNGWLNGIRALNPPTERTALPPFMQTAAWWQQKMNTQLAAWAQLRHDNLLYAKPSYTGGITCEFPYSYVEPIPAFFEAMARLGETAADRFTDLGTDGWTTTRIVAYFRRFGEINAQLAAIARKELDGRPLSEHETTFLRQMLRVENICGEQLNGWYTELYYGGGDQAKEPDLVVADIHTAPTDAAGNMVGWVQHVGTGPLNMAVVTAMVPEVGPVAFVGPVMSYYEHLSTGFERLTDEVWATAYAQAPSARPDFVNLYLAGTDGGPREGAAPSLATGLEPAPEARPLPASPLLTQNYPNPFQDRTTIRFTVPHGTGPQRVMLAIYDAQGRQVQTLVDQTLPGGHYAVPWDGTLAGGARAASGTYFYRLQVGDRHTGRGMTLIR